MLTVEEAVPLLPLSVLTITGMVKEKKMNFMVRTSYPYHKFNEVTELHNKTEARPHSVRTQGVYIRPELNHGWESYAIYEVEEGKETEFTQWINRILGLFVSTEGFSAQIDTVIKVGRPTSRG